MHTRTYVHTRTKPPLTECLTNQQIPEILCPELLYDVIKLSALRYCVALRLNPCDVTQQVTWRPPCGVRRAIQKHSQLYKRKSNMSGTILYGLSMSSPINLNIHFRVPSHSGNQGKPWKWVPFFPVRENSGNLGKTQKIRENSGNLWQWPRTERVSPVWGMCVLCHVSKLCSFTDWL